MDTILDKFGELLVKQVRDRTITEWEKILHGQMKSDRARRVQEQIADLNPDQKQTVANLVPQIVDTSLHWLLAIIEESESIDVRVEAQNVKDASDGLCGELYGHQGWIARYSTKSKRAL